MEIRDSIHGAILIEPHELKILDSPYFQRLRQIKQMGFSENSFPSASHNRYVHSLGALNAVSQAFERIFLAPSSKKNLLSSLGSEHFQRWRAAVRLAALLHDIGHGPLSHTTEFAMPALRELKLPEILIKARGSQKKATHEDYTLKMILDSGLTALIEKAGHSLGFTPLHVASLIDPALEIQDQFFRATCDGVEIDFHPILRQLISSELDSDRMDYLRRDSLHAGVSYGQFDYHWLISNLTYHIHEKCCYLALQHRALYTFEDFLISRFHMFLMVYFHHKSVVYDEMLAQYLSSAECSYKLPSDIEDYCQYTDTHLTSHLAQSKDPWARRIAKKQPYSMLVELHSGIPATPTARSHQKQLLLQIEKTLKAQDISFLKVTSTGELSKYSQKSKDPIFVKYDDHYHAPSFIPLEQCTDLFQKYSEKRLLTRLYVSPENYSRCRYQGRHLSLKYEETSGN